jgi:hypothetical protein|nr:hypothetical protein [Neorhizobium tomejilense]
MIFEIPFKYEISGRKEGRELNSKSARWEFARIDVPNVSSDDAPIVVEWTEADDLQRSSFNADKAPVLADDGRQHVRYYDGRHWLPVLASHVARNGYNHRLGASQFSYFIRNGDTIGALAPPMDYQRRPIPKGNDDPYAGYATVNSSNRNENIAQIAKAYEDFLVVDDMVYTLAAEPKIVARMTTFDIERAHGRMGYMGTALEIVADKDFVLDSDCALFPIDRFDVAISHTRRKNARILQKDEFNAYNLRREPTVNYPDHAEKEDNSVAVIETYARSFVSTFEKIPGNELDTSSIRLYADIRDGLALLPDEEGVAMIDRAAAALLETERNPQRGGIWPKCFVFLRGVVETAAARPVEIELAIPRGLSHGPR